MHLRHSYRRPVPVPNHPEIARGTLRMMMNQVYISQEDFLETPGINGYWRGTF
ncbi:hypothetical protein [Methanospirillum hungatei]|uniref:hypothetical protein n=1 Tax=Methanospirillum hungatei TaxID=2203 RepID=UPI002A1FA392|nr:type II toxin-antitoxin system HicA family toxin [Methanospirillum hungatei]